MRTAKVAAVLLAAAIVPVTPAQAKKPPLNVSASLGKAAVTKSIGPSGGTVKLKTSTGAAFTLAIPAGALTEARTITMSQVAKIGRYPFSSRTIAAAQLGPEGLQLNKPATLTITTKRSIPLAHQAPYAYRLKGKDFHLYPPARDRKHLTLKIVHFSGYGEGDASAAQMNSVSAHAPADATARSEASAADVLIDARDHNKSFDDAGVQDALAHALLPTYRSVAGGLTATLGGGDWRGAMNAALQLDRQLNLLGYSSDFLGFTPPKAKDAATRAALATLRTSIQSNFWRVMENAYARAKASCARTKDRAYAKEMLTIGKETAYLDHGHEISFDKVMQDAKPCMRLGFTFSVTFPFDWGTAVISGAACGSDPLSATWTLTLDTNGFAVHTTTTFPPDGVIPTVSTPDRTSADGTYWWQTRFELIPGDTPQIKLTLLPLPQIPEWNGTQTVALEDNPSCPNPTS
jgi:hypothetical protein